MTRLAIVIATLGRPMVLRSVLDQFDHQTRRADRVIVSAVSPADTLGAELSPTRPEILYGTKGTCAQRNRGMAAVENDADVLLFLDDDFVPANDYFAQLVDLFEREPDLVGATGRVIADGVKTAGYTFEEALRFLADDVRPAPAALPCVALYGCNMAIRMGMAAGISFDERLPFYGWLEDVDFTYRLGKRGPMVNCNQLAGVHLANKGGRTSGVRFGYSQVANPIYMLRKGSIPKRLVFEQVFKNVLSNVVCSFRPEPYVDRRGRLRGNIRGFRDLITARLDPERILTME